jgi:tetratricopeptide (TPR) repeat protein
MHRQALTAAGLLAALAVGSGHAGAQPGNRGVPNPDTPKILVPTFRVAGASERGLGVQGADAVRNRLSQEFTAKQLWAIPKNDINATLEASGYRPDSALSPSDIKELAKIMRADEIIDGEVTRMPDGSVKVAARMLLSRDVSLSQPLGDVTAKSLGDAAKPIARELAEARKQLKDNRDCENHLRGQKYDEAIASAHKGIAAYPKATLVRLCMASALSAKKASPDEIIKVTDEVIAVDSKNRIALGLKYGAQKEKGDVEGSIATLQQMVAADPTNQQLIETIVTELARLDAGKAADIITKLVADFPGDPNLVKTQWQVLGRANRYKDFIRIGEELVKLDTAAMDSTWFFRMTAAAAADSNPTKAAEYASRAVQRFPRSASFLALQAQTLQKAGQLPQAVEAMKRAVSLDPKVENGYLFIVVRHSEMNQPDSAKAWATKAIESGTDKSLIGTALLASVSPAIQKANTSKLRADWQEALKLAQAVEEIAPTENSAYFIGIASFQVGYDILQGLQKSRSCAEVGQAEDMLTLAQTTMPRGGKVDPATAGQIMSALGQLMPAIPQYKRQLCARGGGNGRSR